MPNETHSTVPTPDPTKRALVVQVEESVFADNPFILPPTGTPYSKCPPELFAGDYRQQFSNFIFTGQTGDHGITFSPPGPANDDGAPAPILPFRSTWSKFGNHRWCPILKGLAFIEDPNFPLATNLVSGGQSGVATAPRNYVRELYIQEVNEGSRFLLDEFLGPAPFRIGRYPVPQPGRVSYQINGLSGTFEECLHDDIDIPSTRSTSVTFLGTTEGVSDSRLPGQFFPRTNVRNRTPYILTVDQALQGGVWYMQRLRVFPPRQPRLTTE